MGDFRGTVDRVPRKPAHFIGAWRIEAGGAGHGVSGVFARIAHRHWRGSVRVVGREFQEERTLHVCQVGRGILCQNVIEEVCGLGALGIEEACAPNNVGALVVLCQAQNNDATIIATTTIAAAAKSRQYCGGR